MNSQMILTTIEKHCTWCGLMFTKQDHITRIEVKNKIVAVMHDHCYKVAYRVK